jgi:hypothetical protein
MVILKYYENQNKPKCAQKIVQYSHYETGVTEIRKQGMIYLICGIYCPLYQRWFRVGTAGRN